MAYGLTSPRGASPDSAKMLGTPKKKTKRPSSENPPRDTSGGGQAAGATSPPSTMGLTSPRKGSGDGPLPTSSGRSSGSAPPLTASDTIRPSSGFGQQYVGASYPDLWSNPDVLAADWMGQNGITPQGGGGMWKVYQDLSQVMPQLFMLTQGMGNPDQASFASFLDYANQFMNQYSTPGAGTVSPNVVGNLFSAGGNSPLGAMLNNPDLDPSQQANLLLGLLGGGLATSMPGAAASGYTGQADALSKQWMAQQAKGGKGGSFADYLQQNGFADLFK